MTERPDVVRVLLVEDDEEDYLIERKMIVGCEPVHAALQWARTLREALEALAAPPDVILLDLSLPDSNGWETLDRIGAAQPDAPVLILTGASEVGMGEEAVRRGAQDYVCKGDADRDRLWRAIRYAIERHRGSRELRASRDRYERLLDAVHSYTYTVLLREGAHVSTQHSPGCQAVTGYLPEHYASDPSLWLAMVHPDDRERVLRHIGAEPGSPHHGPIEHRIRRADGALRWVRSTILHHYDGAGRLIRYDGLIEDVTERRTAEDALRRALEDTESRVVERTRELAQSNRELSDAVRLLKNHDEAKNQFVSNVSHELKTPLTSMTFAVNNLLRGIVAPLQPPVRAYIQMIKRDCERLGETVADILDMSRIEANTLTLHRVRIPAARFVLRAVDALRIQAAARRHTLDAAPLARDTFALCDRQKMEHVLTNVIGNAVKYTPEGGTIRVDAMPDPETPDHIRIRVTDNGVGIPPDSIAHVTERYYRVGEHVSGSGLGLSIAKDIVERHGGRLTIQSPPPGLPNGTLVTLLLPRVQPPDVLVADGPDGYGQRVLAPALRADGYRTTVAPSLPEALERAVARAPDILILCVEAGEDRITEIAARIKADAALRRSSPLAVGGQDVDAAKRAVLHGLGIPLMDKQALVEEIVAGMEETAFNRAWSAD